MQNVEITAHVPDGDAGEVFRALCDFERYPSCTDAVRAVTITERTGKTMASMWEVNFRNGILRWEENDRVDVELRTIHFTQTSGDLDRFEGTWRVDTTSPGCLVRFTAEFDLGMPTLAPMLDPIAANALHNNVGSIIRGLVSKPITILAQRTAC